MTTALITDGTNIVNFDNFRVMDIIFQTTNLQVIPAPEIGGQTGGQLIAGIGQKAKKYIFHWRLNNDANVRDDPANNVYAFDKFEHLETIWDTYDATSKYQRKVTFEKPDGVGTQTVEGKVDLINTTFVAGSHEDHLIGTLQLHVDNRSVLDSVTTGTTAPSHTSGSIQAQPTLTDGTTTITFDSFSTINYILQTKQMAKVQYLDGGGQQIVHTGMNQKHYIFNWELAHDNPLGDRAYTKFQNLETVWETKHSSNKYHRKVTFARPGSGVAKDVYGRIKTIRSPLTPGEHEKSMFGTLDFQIDNITPTF